MQSILDWGIAVIASIQTARTPMLDSFFIAMSALGSEYFYFVALPFICTMISRTIGIRIALTILASVMINALIKNWVAEPRPFMIDPSVAVVSETGFGFPSGHTQQAALFWGLATLYSRQWWMALFGAFFVGLVGLSRIYLGAHYPTDVLGALVIASLLLFKYRLLVKYGKGLWHPSRRIAVFIGAMVIAIASCLAIPAKDMISAAALGSGLVSGLMFSNHLPPLSPSLRQRFYLAAITAVVLALIFGGLKLIFPAKGDAYYEIFAFARFFLCGFTLNAFPLLLSSFIKPPGQSVMASAPKLN